MLRIIVPEKENYNEEKKTFEIEEAFSLDLEHSLISISKWESKHKKQFLLPEPKTEEETFSYIECMIVTEDYPGNVIERLSIHNLETINSYINESHTGTTFREDPITNKSKKEIISSELIYYWMTVYNIPFSTEEWNLSRLFALIRICNIKQSSGKKLPRRESMAQRKALNEQRRAKLGSRG